jgi:hypothetical protein
MDCQRHWAKYRGQYHGHALKIDEPGFSELQNNAISLPARQTVRIDGHLTVAGTTSELTVNSENPVLNLLLPMEKSARSLPIRSDIRTKD